MKLPYRKLHTYAKKYKFWTDPYIAISFETLFSRSKRRRMCASGAMADAADTVPRFWVRRLRAIAVGLMFDFFCKPRININNIVQPDLAHGTQRQSTHFFPNCWSIFSALFLSRLTIVHSPIQCYVREFGLRTYSFDFQCCPQFMLHLQLTE